MNGRIKHSCHARDRRPANEGYLLVEVLATMTISAFILAALFSAVSLTLHTAARVDRSGQSTENVSRVMAALSREIEEIAPLRWAGPNAGFVFEGAPDRLLFAREDRSSDEIDRERAVILQATGNQLLRSEAPLLPNYRTAADIAKAPAQDMLDGRFQVRFAFFSRLASGREALTDNWNNPALLPVAIRVSLSGNRGGPIASARVQVLVSAEPGCAAPARAACSLVVPATDGEDEQPEPGPKVDADDSLGWERYAQ